MLRLDLIRCVRGHVLIRRLRGRLVRLLATALALVRTVIASLAGVGRQGLRRDHDRDRLGQELVIADRRDAMDTTTFESDERAKREDGEHQATEHCEPP